MLNRNGKRWIKVISWIPTIVIVFMIFWFSSQTADASMQTSDWLVLRIQELIRKTGFIRILAVYEWEIYEILTVLVRKSAHATEYALLAVSILYALRCNDVQSDKANWLAWFMTVLYACTDEFHQLFVPGRAGLLTDVMIDAAGAAAGLMVIYLLQKLFGTGKRQV